MKLLPNILCLVCGLIAGFMLKSALSGDQESQTAQSTGSQQPLFSGGERPVESSSFSPEGDTAGTWPLNKVEHDFLEQFTTAAAAATSEEDFVKLLDDIMSQKDSMSVPTIIDARRLLVAQWYDAFPDTALSQMANLKGYERQKIAQTSLLRHIASIDPQLAVTKLSEVSNHEIHSDSAMFVMLEIAGESREESLRLIEQLSGKSHEKALKAVLKEWRGDPKAKAGYLLAAKPSPAAQTAAWETAKELAKTDPEYLLSTTATLEDNPVSYHFIQSAYASMAKKDAKAAAEALEKHQYSKALSHRAYRAVAANWVKQDKEGAIAWANSLTDPDAVSQSFSEISLTLTKKNPAEAQDWLESLPESPSRDHALVSFVNGRKDSDPKTSIEFAMSISDESQRWRMARRTLASWLGQNRKAAETWMQEAQLTPQQIADVRASQ